jgi:hypothetical protein
VEASFQTGARVAGLVGRGAECELIDDLLERASHGQSGVLVIRAEAGMGKTALLRYATDRPDGMALLSVTGVEVEADLDFAGLHSLVRPFVDRLSRLPEPQRAAVAAALGLAPAAETDRFLVSAGVLSLLAAAADDGPVLCVIDDAQWLDVPSADALMFAARRLAAEGIVVLFAAREGERRQLHAPGLPELVLGGLDDGAAMELLEHSRRELAASVRERLITEAAGNPLALLELPAGLSDAQLAGRVPLPDAIPLSMRLQGVFRRHVEQLPEPTRAALLVAAADEGSELSLILAATAELGLPGDALNPAEHAGLVEIDRRRLIFRHPLVRSAVYESAPFDERRRAHLALANACTGGRHEDRKLWHRALATLGADEALAAALEQSARGSQLRGGHASASTGFERAAMLSETEPAGGRRPAAGGRGQGGLRRRTDGARHRPGQPRAAERRSGRRSGPVARSAWRDRGLRRTASGRHQLAGGGNRAQRRALSQLGNAAGGVADGHLSRRSGPAGGPLRPRRVILARHRDGPLHHRIAGCRGGRAGRGFPPRPGAGDRCDRPGRAHR